MDPEIKELLERKNELTDEELVDLEQRLVAASQEAAEQDTDESLEVLSEIKEAVTAVRAEAVARETAAAERAAKRDELLNEINPVAEETTEEAPAEETVETSEEPTAETPVETPTAEETETPAEEVEQPEAVAASAPARPSLAQVARQRPAAHKPAPAPAKAPLVITAAGDVPGYSAGSSLPTPEDIGQAFADKVHAVFAGGGNLRQGRYPVATMSLQYPEERMLDGNDSSGNQEKIESVVGESAIVAAGGLCAPVAASYDLANISTDERPIRDALARFGAERGGIRFITPPKLSGVGGATVVWTEANDTTPAEPATKPCLVISCGAETTVLVDAVTKCLEVGNFSRRTFPEQFAAWWALAGANHAREAENNLWDQIVTNSTAVTAQQWTGASREVLTTLDRTIAAYRFRHRMSQAARLRLIVPSWLRDMFRADLTRQVAGDSTMGVTDAEIDAWFAVRGVNVTYSPDASDQAFTGTQGVGPLIGWPSTVQVLLFHEGAHLFLDGGELNFGMEIRDSSLNSTNDVQAFTETFEASAFVGVESLAITIDVCPDGSSSAAIDIAATLCSAGS